MEPRGNVITTSIRVVGVLEFDGRASICKLPINVVTTNKPKVLTGLHQKVRDGYGGIQLPPIGDTNITGEQAEPNPSRYTSGTWKVRSSPARESEP